MAKRRGRAVSIDGLVERLSALDRERIAIQQRIASALRALGVPSPFSPLSASPRRGRATGKAKGTRKRRKMSADARKAVGERMKKYWAERRKQGGKK